MFGNDAYLGSFNLKSVVIIAGKLSLSVCNPPSISLVTSTVSPLIFTSDALVAWG